MHEESELVRRFGAMEERIARLERIVNNLVSHASRGAAPSPVPSRVAWVRPDEPAGRASELTAAQARAVRAYETDTDDAPEAGPTSARAGIEQFIGMRAFAYAGALVVVLAIALFLKLAYDEGWLRMLDPAMRCLATGVFGAVLLAGAEVVRRRINVFAASGLNLAGLGCIYASAYAAGAVFHLLPPASALLALAGVAGLGVGVGVRARLPLVSILACAAGYGAPFLLDDTLSHPLIVPAYLAALLFVSVSVASVRPSAYVALRHVAAAGTMLGGAVWAREQSAETLAHVLVFLSVVWGVLHVDGVRYSWRGASRDLASPLLLALVSTAWATVVGLDAIAEARDRSLEGQWHWAGYLGALSLVMALVCGRGVSALRGAWRGAPTLLANVLWAQSVTLGALALGLAFDEWPREASWLGLGLTLAVCGRLFGWRLFDGLAFVVLLVSTLGAMEGQINSDGPVREWGGFKGTIEFALVLLHAGAFMGLGVMLRPEPAWWRRLGVVSAWSAVAWAAMSLAFARRDDGSQDLTVALGAMGFLLVFVHALAARLRLRGAALTLLPFVVLTWMIESKDWLVGDVSARLFLGAELWSAMFVCGLSAALLWVFVRRWAEARRRGDRSRKTWALYGSVLAGMLGGLLWLGATSFELARAGATLTDDPLTRAATVSVYWALLAVGLIAFGFARRVSLVRHVGLGLMSITAAKAIVVDASHTTALARVIAMLTVGLLMLGVALAYARLHARAGRGAGAGRSGAEE